MRGFELGISAPTGSAPLRLQPEARHVRRARRGGPHVLHGLRVPGALHRAERAAEPPGAPLLGDVSPEDREARAGHQRVRGWVSLSHVMSSKRHKMAGVLVDFSIACSYSMC